jgi:hypothetical protein
MTAEVEVRQQPRANAFALALFSVSLCFSALFLFAIQPMFTKMVLPILGGTPAVWSVAMVFFQALLFAGYLYAHLLTRHLNIGMASGVHIAVTMLAFAALPIGVAAGWGTPPTSGQAFWLLGMYVVSVGLPFFALSANAPLLQAWFARSLHAKAGDPYFLYAASNLGSFAALAAYPFLIEPHLTLHDQSRVWTLGFAFTAVSIVVCAGVLLRSNGVAPTSIADTRFENAPTWRHRLQWVGYAFVPAGLLIAVTAHISTDVAAVPLLWIIPLAIYLLTFVLSFRQPIISDALLRILQPAATALALLGFMFSSHWIVLTLLHLGAFFLNSMVFHRALYGSRPAASYLTTFYLCMSLGGALGGISCALLAPMIFNDIAEYPLLLLVALVWQSRNFRVSGAPLLTLVGRALPLGAVGLLAGTFLFGSQREGRQTFRSFFGVHKVFPSEDGRFRILGHGTTIHGAMRVQNEDGSAVTGPPEPTTYYAFEGALGSAIALKRAADGGHLSSVAVIGLGAGSLSCHSKPGESWTFFEIDAEVLRLAQDSRYFRFLRDCGPKMPIVLGDARLTLPQEADKKSILIIDAFSSDSIPLHLLTKEAFGMYLSKLNDTGILVAHISNRHLGLSRVLARVGAEHGLVTYLNEEIGIPPDIQRSQLRSPSVVAVLARKAEHLGALSVHPAWKLVEPEMTRRPWTDDYSNIFEAILDRARQNRTSSAAPAP